MDSASQASDLESESSRQAFLLEMEQKFTVQFYQVLENNNNRKPRERAYVWKELLNKSQEYVLPDNLLNISLLYQYGKVLEANKKLHKAAKIFQRGLWFMKETGRLDNLATETLARELALSYRHLYYVVH